MSTSDGQVTNAVYGFTSMLAIVLASRPEFAAAAFDLAAPTFRSKEYVEYKAGRRAMPEDLRPQIEKVRDVLESFSIPIYSVEGFEADDVIGTLARIAEERGHAVTIVSGDLDCLQLVTESVEALVPRRGITDTFVYGPDQVRRRYGFEPPQLIDFKALRGDTSDNIPGVPGVGDKTAAKLVQDFGSVEAILERVEELPEGRLKKSLKEHADKIRLGKRMVTIVRDVPVELDLERSRWTRYDYDKVRTVFDRLEFRQLLSRFPPPDQVPVQPTLTFETAPRTEGLKIVDDAAEAASLVAGATDVGVFAFTETSGRGARTCGLGVATGRDTFYVARPDAMDAVASELTEGKPISGHDAKEAELGTQLAAIEAEVEEVAGQKFNLGAPQQLAKVLFEDLRLPVGKRTKTGYSTDADTLEALRDKHPIVGLILEHRQLSKLKSTYVDALPQLVDPLTGRVHTSFGQASTATGRLSSSNPNLMNIPIRTELGQRIRRAFKASRPGHVMVSADYSQIELRIAAHLSGDPNLMNAFKKGQDIHTATAAAVFKIPIESVDPNQRRLAKVANFGSIYGQGEYGLSQQLGIPGDVAREFLGQYWSTYARLREYLDEVRKKARGDGFVVSATGRRRSIPDLRSPNFQLRSAAERMAINFPMQSLAADIIKIAMVRLQREIEADHIEGRMLLQVHDELLFEVPESEVDRFAETVPRIMTGAYELETGIEVEAKVGPNWADMRKLAVVRV